MSLMLHAKFQEHGTSGFEEENFKGFYYISTWQPSWPCDLDNLYKILFLFPMEATKNSAMIG